MQVNNFLTLDKIYIQKGLKQKGEAISGLPQLQKVSRIFRSLMSSSS